MFVCLELVVLHCFVNPGVGGEVVLAKPLQMCVTEDVSMDGAGLGVE